MREREINLFDLAIEILLGWRAIVVAMVIGAVLMGGLGYVRSSRAIRAQRTQPEFDRQMEENVDIKAQLEDEMTAVQIANVETVVDNEALNEEQERYYNESVLMQMDANAVPRAEVTFYVKTSEGTDMDVVNNLVQVYEDLVAGMELKAKVAEELGISQATVNELITLRRSTVSQQLPTSTMRVVIYGTDEEQCQEIMDVVIAYINEQRAAIASAMGAHEISILNQSCAVVTDAGLLDRQRTMTSNIVSYKNSVAKAKDTFSDEEWQYYNYVTIGKAVADPKAVSDEGGTETQGKEDVIARPTLSKKLIVVGMILAVFIYAFIILLKYILNTKILATDNLQRLYNISVLGQVPDEKATKKLFGFVDRWILAMRDRNKRKFTTNEAVHLAATAVKIAASKEGLKEIYCIGCDMKKQTQAVCAEMAKLLEENHIQLNVLNNVLYDAEAMGKLESAKGVILVETVGVTMYQEIVQELELLRRQEIEVLGCVVVE